MWFLKSRPCTAIYRRFGGFGFAMHAMGCLLVLGTMVADRAAIACDIDPCPVPQIAPFNGSSVPANARVLVVRAWQFVDILRSELHLKDQSGVEFSLEFSTDGDDLYVFPVQTFVPGGRYCLSFAFACPVLPNRILSGVSCFQAGPIAPVPLESGEISIVEIRRDDLGVSSVQGSCTSDIDAMIVRYAIAPSENLRPFLALTRFEILVDRSLAEPFVWSRSFFGEELEGFDGARVESRIPGGRHADQVFARCSGWSESEDCGLAPGIHTLEVRAQIAGLNWCQASSRVPVDLRCDPKSPEEGVDDIARSGIDDPDCSLEFEAKACQSDALEGSDSSDQDALGRDGGICRGCAAIGLGYPVSSMGMFLIFLACILLAQYGKMSLDGR